MYEFDGKNWKDSHHDMKERRWGHSCVVVEDQIIVVGGNGWLKTSEIFNIQNRSWRSGPNLSPFGIALAKSVKVSASLVYNAYFI